MFAASVFPQSLRGIAEVLRMYAHPEICVFHSGAWGESVEEIAVSAGLRPRVADRDVILIKTEELWSLLEEWSIPDISIFDVPPDFTEAALVAVDWPEPAVLRALPDSRMVLNCHDDCYLYI